MNFLFGSWSGCGLFAWLVVWPVAWLAGLDHIICALPAFTFAVVRFAEIAMPVRPMTVLCQGRR